MKEFGEAKREWAVSELGEFSERVVTVFRFDSQVACIKSVDRIDKDWPENVREECARQFGWKAIEREPELAENEALRESGRVWSFHWEDGEAKFRENGGNFCRWHFGGTGPIDPVGDAWFRKHCPSDRFVTEDGEVAEFVLNDDGGAMAMCDGKLCACVPAGPSEREGAPPIRLALSDFRDQERAKWAHMRWDDLEGGVFVRKEGTAGAWYSGHWDSGAKEYVPLWKRREVEALYREKNPEWRVEWDEQTELVNIIKQGKVVAVISHRTRMDALNLEQVPVDTLTQARAKFRENYELKRDEIWFQGMPVTMVFEEGTNVPDRIVTSNGKCDWLSELHEASRNVWHTVGVTFTNESERLEAYDRMRRFFYEEHPGKCLLPYDLGPAEFWMTIDGKSMAVDANGESCAEIERDGTEVGNTSIDWEPVYRKLRAWTKSQLAKKPVVFEGKVTCANLGDENGPGCVMVECADMAVKSSWPFMYKSVRVTLEPVVSPQ